MSRRKWRRYWENIGWKKKIQGFMNKFYLFLPPCKSDEWLLVFLVLVMITWLMLLPLFSHCLLISSWYTCLSYFHGLPNNTWHASMGTTSHNTSSLYFLMKKFRRTWVITLISPSSLNHCSFLEEECPKSFTPQTLYLYKWKLCVHTTNI